MTTLNQRLADQEYKNWVRAALALQYLKEELTRFADVKSRELHTKVQRNIQHFPTCSGNCKCIFNELKNYRTYSYKELIKKNADLKQLSASHWQIAKLYMNPNQDAANTDPQNTDISGVLNFIENCRETAQYFSDIGKVTKVREFRNKIMHTSDMKVKQADFQVYISAMLDLLNDPDYLRNHGSAKDAADMIKKIDQEDLEITTENEAAVIKARLDSISSEMNQFRSELSECKDDTGNVQEKISQLEGEFKKLITRVNTYGDQPNLQQLVSSLKTSLETVTKELETVKKEQQFHKQALQEQGKIIQDIQTRQGAQEKVPTEEEIEILAQYLKDGYDGYLKIRVLHEGYKISVGEIFSPVILTYSKNKLSSYKDMLCGEQKKQFFLKGEAGSGKTTFCKHLIDVWRTKSETQQFQDPEELREFTFVFHVSFRFAKATESILEMICEQLLDDESKKRVAKYVLQYCPEKCFIIADGLDEWQCSPEKVSGWRRDIPGLPSRKGVEDCLILITSRPWRLQALPEEIEPKSIFELDGLQTPQLLIKNILSKMENPQPEISCKNFLSEVKSCHLDEMMKTPLILIIMLSIWAKDKSLHPSVSQNYIRMIESLILRANDEQHWTGHERRLMEPLVNNPEYWKKQWEEKSSSLPSCCQKLKSFQTFAGLILSLSHLAFDLLYGESATDKQKLVFSEKDCKEYLCKEELNVCLGIGILSKSQTPRGIEKIDSYSFPHKSIQEFLAAVWLAGPDGADSVGRIKEQIRNKGIERTVLGDLELLIKFLCGLSAEVGADIFIYCYKYYDIDYNLPAFVLTCSVESQHCNNTTHVYPTLPGIIVVRRSISVDEFRMLTDIMKSPSSGLRCLHIWKLSLDHSSIDLLYQSLSCCGNLEYLRLEGISCSDDRRDNISSVLDLKNLHKLEKLTLRWLSVRTVLWPQVTNSCLRELNIYNLNLTHGCVEELCRTYEQYRQSEMKLCEVRYIHCVDHRTRCNSFKDLQRHIMSVNLPHSDDGDNNVDNDNVDNHGNNHQNQDSADGSCCCNFCTQCTLF